MKIYFILFNFIILGIVLLTTIVLLFTGEKIYHSRKELPNTRKYFLLALKTIGFIILIFTINTFIIYLL